MALFARKPLALFFCLVACASSAPLKPAPEGATAPAPAAAAQRSASAHPAGLQPPVAKKEPKDVTVHGDKRVDDYFWLRNKGTPEVEQYLKAEAAYADAMMEKTRPLQEKLYGEMLSRVQETDVSAPFRKDGFFYYTRTEKGLQYPILCRKQGSLSAPEQVLLDVNQLARGKKFLGFGQWVVSDDASLLAYSIDDTGFRQYDLHVKDLRSGADRPEKIARVDSFSWTADGKTLFYVTEDATTKRANQLWRHTLSAPAGEARANGGGAGKDDLVFEEKDEMFGLDLGRSRSKKLLFLVSASHTASEVRFFRADDRSARMTLVQPREKDHEYYADEGGGLLYIRTNSQEPALPATGGARMRAALVGGRNFRLVTAPLSSPGKEHWKEIVPHRDDVMLLDIDVFKDWVVRYEREGGLPQVTIMDLRHGGTRRLQFPEPDYHVSPDRNEEFNQSAYRINYQSLVSPPAVYDYDMKTGARTLVKQVPVPNYDPSRYEVERVWAPAQDGVRIPVALVHKKGVARDGKSPLYLYAYGSYGISIPDFFSQERFSLVDRGVTCAIAHIRGGGEMGKKWHDAGRMMNKKNTFSDFIAAAEYLTGEGYTAKDRLAIAGGSAGGLLMGAVLNMRPDLFKVAIASVPFVDVINTMLDESLPLTVGEFEEWGNPKEEPAYRYMRSYSPYDNVEPKAYPIMLVRSSYNDSQVMYWEPAKWVAKLRATKTDSNPLLFNIKMDPAGHGGASGRYDRLHDVAYDDAFLLTYLGVTKGESTGGAPNASR
ncbi:MAG TPA: S9 family peptidase [Myxococcales bacterium]|jgi:oligopeptidase B